MRFTTLRLTVFVAAGWVFVAAGWVFVAAVSLGACALGDDDEIDSPYERATLSVPAPDGVADGFTGVDVTVTGEVGDELTLIVTGSGASLIAANGASAQEKTVFLSDQGGMGVASVSVVSTAVDVVTVALKADPVRSAQEIAFAPVRLAIGAPTPVRLQPGQVVHEVCVATNSSRGAVRADSLTVDGAFGPVRVDVRPEPPNSTCPTESPDPAGWQGYAAFTWATAVDFAQVSMSYLGPGDAALASDVLALQGEAFTGYQVVAQPPTPTPSFLSVELQVNYPAIGQINSGPAEGVAIGDIRFIPESGPAFLGSSSGGASETPQTDQSGSSVLFFDTSSADPGTFALFVTPQNGATVYLTDITVPAPARAAR